MVKELGMEPDEIEKVYLNQVGRKKTGIIRWALKIYSKFTNRKARKKRKEKS
jgi:hypothetical protein